MGEGAACRDSRAADHVVPFVGPLLAIADTESCTFVNDRGVTTTFRRTIRHRSRSRTPGGSSKLLQGVGLAMILTAIAGGHRRLDLIHLRGASLALEPTGA